MITIFHGDDNLKSRQALEEIKKQNQESEVLLLSGKRLDLTQLKQALESVSLLASARLVIIENFLSAKKNKIQEEVLLYLQKNPPPVDLVFWEAGEVNKSILAKISQAKVLLFKPEPVLFKFLESLKPDSQKEMLRLLKETLKNEPVEIIFYMLIRQLRILLVVNDGLSSGLEELDRLAPWQKQKFTRQAKYFSQEKLLELYHQLLEIDSREKSGQASFDLTRTLELFLINL